jgi:hypothetical protein
MEKKYFYVDNLSEYGRKLSCKFNSAHWQFANLEDGVYCLYNKKTGKIVMSRKHPEDESDAYIAFAICYHKYMGLAEPKERYVFMEVVASNLKIGDNFYLLKNSVRPLRCCGYDKNNDILYERVKGHSDIFRLKPSTTVYIKKENK